MSTGSRLCPFEIKGRLSGPAPEFNWRTRRATKLIKMFGLPTFSRAFLQSSAFTLPSLQKARCKKISFCQFNATQKFVGRSPRHVKQSGLASGRMVLGFSKRPALPQVLAKRRAHLWDAVPVLPDAGRLGGSSSTPTDKRFSGFLWLAVNR